MFEPSSGIATGSPFEALPFGLRCADESSGGKTVRQISAEKAAAEHGFIVI